jgi:hypothetical protein
MRIEGSNFNFQVSFRASLSSQEVRQKFLRKVRAEGKESKNLFAVIRAEEKESSSGLGLEFMLTPGQTRRIGESETK